MRGARDRKRTANRSYPLTYSGQAEAGGLCHADRIPAAIIFNAYQKRIFRPAAALDPKQDLARGAMAQRVGQAFLHDAIGRASDHTAHVSEIALQVEL
jgi:hypothetical protein